MPSPVRHGVSAKGLQAGGIRVEAELAVTERNLPVQIVPLDVVACDQGVTVDGFIRRRQRSQRRQQHGGKCEREFHHVARSLAKTATEMKPLVQQRVVTLTTSSTLAGREPLSLTREWVPQPPIDC